MAEVFLAEQSGARGFARQTVIKRILMHRAEEPIFIKSFEDEARLAAKLQHPNIVRTEDFGDEAGQLYLALEYVPGEDLDSLERAFDAIKYRNFSDHPYLDIQVHGETDKPTVSILAQFVPQEREGGWDETARATLTEAIIERLADFAPSLRDRIVGHELLTPNDLSQRYGLTGGHLHHGEHALDQMWWLRPLASCARFATPVKGLWLGGSGSHPGGGITCGPGALAAAAILG